MKKSRRGKRGGRKQRERLLARLLPKAAPIDPQTVFAMRARLTLLTKRAG